MVRTSVPLAWLSLTIAHVLFENTHPKFEYDGSIYFGFHTVSSNAF